MLYFGSFAPRVRSGRTGQVTANAGRAGRRRRVPGSFESTYLEQLRHLVFVVQELSLARDLAAIQRTVCCAARHLAGADGACFIRLDHGHCYYAEEDAIAPLFKGKRFALSQCIGGWCMHHRAQVVIDNIASDPRIQPELYRDTFVRSLAVVPVRTLDPVGALGVYWSSERRPNEHQLSLLQALADSAAAAMENINLLNDLEERVRERTHALEAAYEEIRDLALIDDLTGLRNRRGFFLLAQQQRRQAARSGDPAFIVFLDIDGLKQVNDSLGHEAGDQLLRGAARVLQITFRESDILARLGGDEFCVFAVDGICNPQMIRERLLRNIAAFNSSRLDSPFPLSASIGIYPCAADDPTPLEQFVRRADEAMYVDKRSRHALAMDDYSVK